MWGSAGLLVWMVFSVGATAIEVSHEHRGASNRQSANNATCNGEGEAGRVCRITFPMLWSNSSAYTSKVVRITGYIAAIDGEVYLFPSKNLFVYAAAQGGILIILPKSDRTKMLVLLEKEQPITFIGRFDQMEKGLITGSIGRLQVNESMFWPQEMPGEVPELPPLRDRKPL